MRVSYRDSYGTWTELVETSSVKVESGDTTIQMLSSLVSVSDGLVISSASRLLIAPIASNRIELTTTK